MRKSYEQKQVYILMNQFFIVVFLCYAYMQNNIAGTENLVSLLIVSLIIIDGAYIGYVNIKDHITLSKFSNLLLLVSWQFLLSLNENQFFHTLSTLLSVVILYKTSLFLLFFFFQDTTYTYKKITDWTLKTICSFTIISIFINDRLFAVLFLCQFILSFGCMISLFLKHRKRMIFVLKSEKKHLLKSFAIIILPFTGYILLFTGRPEYLSNLGWYMMITLPLFSIHSITFKNKKIMEKYFSFKKGNLGIMSLFSLISIISLGMLFHFNVINFFIILHTIFLLVLLYFTLLYRDVKDTLLNSDTEESRMLQESFYTHSLMQVAKEEELKRDISNYLHDEILQDILSIKNMMHKSNKEEIHKMIVNTLDDLNLSIREQMQEYHPTLLKTLTLKENYIHSVEMIQQKYGMKNIKITFNCEEDLFLVDPYNLVIYRMLKELVTNALKHSKCSQLVLSLAQENDEIELIVKDNGVGLMDNEKHIPNNHRGLNSIKEQLFLLNGNMTISECHPSGLCIAIRIPMQGDDSYQYFINR
ncbi:sensor histidine kinase [Bacillus sp. FJAT-52991]|uniref:ATP-binding protein n=1 Tax=Bacillus kandeliae TaxID=3129297 RepID=A0ABZ2N5L7_9BACI